MSDYKFCRDCAWVKKGWMDSWEYVRCGAPEARHVMKSTEWLVHKKFSKVTLRYCDEMRRNRCGTEALWFKSRRFWLKRIIYYCRDCYRRWLQAFWHTEGPRLDIQDEDENAIFE